MRVVSILISATLGMMPIVANASEGVGQISSGSITIRVIIPPLAAALQAQSEGAVGLWTIEDTKSALMINLPSSVDDKGNATGALYHGSDMPIAVAADVGSAFTLTTARPTPMNGLTRESFSIARMPSARLSDPSMKNGTLVVSAI